MSNIELKDLIELHLSSIREEIKSASQVSEIKFDAVIKKQDEQIAHAKETNGRVTKLEHKDNIREMAENKKEVSSKLIMWKMAAMVIASAFLAALISNVGLLEFLKLVK